ncbi:MAG: hypothetical protein ABIT37_21065 [Luteolibacter sp.]
MIATLRFQTGGGLVDCLYTEAIDLRTLGPLQITRATDIRFDETSQQWEVHEAGSDRILCSHPSRAECLAWEHQNLQPGAPAPKQPNKQSVTP